MSKFEIGGRPIGNDYPPLVIAEIGINHEGRLEKAIKMVDDAKESGCECVKFQYHIPSKEMIPNSVIPGNAKESIWEIISRCTLSDDDERAVKKYSEQRGLIYLSTPFSREAADNLLEMGVNWFKIGSGECNNFPLIKHIARFGKPVILSTGMNDIESISIAVNIFREHHIPYALMHCTSLYPTPYEKVRLGALDELRSEFPDAIIGLSDHSIGNYTCFAAIALGASIVEKHFTSDPKWPGPDVPISITPGELSQLVAGTVAIYKASGGSKTVLPEESVTIDFAYSSVVTIAKIKKGEIFSLENIWVKRPGNGEILAGDYESLLGQSAARDISPDTQISWSDVISSKIE
jgi:sialic acid synthase SpsE